MTPEAFIDLATGPLGALMVLLVFGYGFYAGWWRSSGAVSDMKTGYEKAISEAEKNRKALHADRDYWRELAGARDKELAELNAFIRDQALPAIVRFTDLIAETDGRSGRGRRGETD